MTEYFEIILDYYLQCIEMSIKKEEAYDMTVRMTERFKEKLGADDMKKLAIYINRIHRLVK